MTCDRSSLAGVLFSSCDRQLHHQPADIPNRLVKIIIKKSYIYKWLWDIYNILIGFHIQLTLGTRPRTSHLIARRAVDLFTRFFLEQLIDALKSN